MSVTFSTTIMKDDGKNATGIVVPADVMAALTPQKRAKVTVELNGYTYRSSVAVMGGQFMLPLSQAHRTAAALDGGSTVEVTLDLDLESRTVEIPDDLKAALAEKAGALDAFDALSDSRRKEFVRQVVEAKAEETRNRRIAGIVAKMGEA